jgi:hypothetical protein
VPLGFAAVKDPDYSGGLKPGGQLSFAEEPLGDPWLLRQVDVQELHRHVQIEIPVTALVDNTHPSLADRGEKLESSDAGESQIGIVGHLETRILVLLELKESMQSVEEW